VGGDLLRGYGSRLGELDTMIVAGSEDERGLKGMLALAQDAIQKQPRPVSSIALRLDGSEWVPWLPEPDHPLFNEFKLRQVQTFGEDYKEQKELLDKLHEKRGEDLFVATYGGIQNKETGRVTTFSVWCGGITSLLPRTDLIAFIERNGDASRMFGWDRVMEVAGGLLQPLAIYPPRYGVSEFPINSQFAAMGEPIDL